MAENNWWGTNDPDVIAQHVYGLVDFEPFITQDPVAIEPLISKAASFNLLNYPNPFRQFTTIAYQLSRSTTIELAIYDATGRRVDTLFSGQQPGGAYSLIWQPSVSAGLYLLQLSTPQQCATRRMVYIR